MTSPIPTQTPAHLVLADGTIFSGRSFGASVDSVGEVVFNTSMTGYPELLTDPSYRRQILTLTYPEIGNYGVATMDAESEKIQVSGLVIRALSPIASNWRSELGLSAWLKANGIPGIVGIDTRALVRRIRTLGAMMGVLHVGSSPDFAALIEQAKALPPMSGTSLSEEVTCQEPTPFSEGLLNDDGSLIPPLRQPKYHVVAIDLGIKKNIARLLVHHGCRVTIVPSHTPIASIENLKPDGIFLTNGPGDPATAVQVTDTVRSLLGTRPIFGICMGHQILARALGASTYKTMFGHRGANQPVKTPDGKVKITSQNHGFAVHTEDISAPAQATVTNVSDDTNEGLDAPEKMAFSVQYHPEAAPGPHDCQDFFEKCVSMMERHALPSQNKSA
jgi:carbamoyl-phosphate synthase small subunit